MRGEGWGEGEGSLHCSNPPHPSPLPRGGKGTEFGAVLVAPGKTRNAVPEVLVMGAVDAEVMV